MCLFSRSEGHQQAHETSSRPSCEGCLANTRRDGSAVSNDRADWIVFRVANQRNLGFAVDRLRFQTIGGFDSTISGREATQQIENGVLGRRSSDRKGLHSGTQEMAIDLCRLEGALAFPEPDDRSSVSRRFYSCRLPCSDSSSVGTWQDRVPHVPPHLPRLAGRDRSTRGRATETYATRAHFDNDGPVWKCLGDGETQSQSANCAKTVETVCQSAADRDSINKGNCEAVPLIGQFWTVTTLEQLPVT
jgi:hypothetical protein